MNQYFWYGEKTFKSFLYWKQRYSIHDNEVIAKSQFIASLFIASWSDFHAEECAFQTGTKYVRKKVHLSYDYKEQSQMQMYKNIHPLRLSFSNYVGCYGYHFYQKFDWLRTENSKNLIAFSNSEKCHVIIVRRRRYPSKSKQ